MADCKGKVAVITGASRGLGADMVQTFLEQGMQLGLCARSACPHDESEAVLTRALDVRDGAGMEAFCNDVADRFGPIDLWINNAGVLEPVRFVRELETQALMDHLAINVAGVLHGSKAFVNHRRAQQGDGVLVNISSGAALKGYAGWGAYCAGKAAVDRLTECIQLEEESTGLRAYSVAPGVIDTQMQTTIRSLTEEEFPMVEKFRDLKAREAFNTPAFVARHLLGIAFDGEKAPDSVVVRLPAEN